MEAIWGRSGCRTGYLNELGNGGMLNDGKFAGDGGGRGSQLGDGAGENPKNGTDGLSAALPRRKLLMEDGFVSCGFISEYALSGYWKPFGGSIDGGERAFVLDECSMRSETDMDLFGSFKAHCSPSMPVPIGGGGGALC